MKNKLKKLICALITVVTIISLFSSIVSANELEQYSKLLYSTDIISRKVDNKVYEMANVSERIPVYIWYKDIDFNNVKNTVVEELGYGEEYIAELDINSSLPKKVIQGKMKKYIKCSRNIAKDMYSNRAMDIINLMGIADKIDFVSSYAPVILANLSINEIESLAKSSLIESIGYYSESISQEYFDDGWTETTVNYDMDENRYEFDQFLKYLTQKDINSNTSLTGNGVTIGMLESGTTSRYNDYLPADRCCILDENRFMLHSTEVAYIMASSNGVAPESFLVSKASSSNFISDVECLLDNGVQVINMSFYLTTSNAAYSFAEDYINYIIKQHGIIIVKSAGNNGNTTGEVSNPGNADNVITVGAYDHCHTYDNSEHFLGELSSYNEMSDCEKPDVIAPGKIECYSDCYTSYATPVVTGTIALMLECRPSLAFHPEIVKAIVMASCHSKVASSANGEAAESMYDGITDRQGAGAINIYTALCITVNGNYGYGIIEENSTETISFYQSPYDATGMNVSITWLRDVEKTEDGYDATERNNLDLYVYKNGYSVFEKDEDGNDINTNKQSSSTEMLYSTISTLTRNYDSEIKYDIEVKYINDDTDNSYEPVVYGFAWSTDKEVYNELEEYEGFYFIKNVATNKYLTYDCEENTVRLIDYKGHYYIDYEQLFVISSKQNGKYKIGSFLSNYDTGLALSEAEVVHSNSSSDISIEQNNEGYYIFKVDDKYLTGSNGVVWESKSNITLNECWIVEKVNYRIGDVDMTGVINESDYDSVADLTGGIYTPTNSEWFLSDTNGDNILNYADLDFYEN